MQKLDNPSKRPAEDTASLERMSPRARRRFLEKRLREVDRRIISLLTPHIQRDEGPSYWELTAVDSALWHDVMALNYLEASRRAILQTLSYLREGNGRSLRAEQPAEPEEGVRARGFVSHR